MSETKVCNKCSIEKKASEYQKHSASPDGLQYSCRECRAVSAKQYRQATKEKNNAYSKQWAKENKERMAFLQKRWRENNRGKHNAKAAKYRAVKRNATVTQQDNVAVDFVYYAAALLKKVFGTSWEVDHIVPLQGANVCGLHIAHNLQVLPEKQNRAKGNKHDC